MIVSTLEIFTNFHILCEPSFHEKGGLVIWIDYYNFFVNDVNTDEDNTHEPLNEILNPMKTNLNFESNERNLCGS